LFEIFEFIIKKDNTRKEAIAYIEKFFASGQFETFLIYYSGHGTNPDGFWVFTDGEVT